MSLEESAEKIVPNPPDIIPTKKTKSANVGLPRTTSMDSIDSGLGPSRSTSVLSLNQGPSRAPSISSLNSYGDKLSAPLENLKLDSSSDSSSVSSAITVKPAIEINATDVNQNNLIISIDSNSQHDRKKIEKSIIEKNSDEVLGSGRSVATTSYQVDAKSRSVSTSKRRQRQLTIMIPEEPPILGKKLFLFEYLKSSCQPYSKVCP